VARYATHGLVVAIAFAAVALGAAPAHAQTATVDVTLTPQGQQLAADLGGSSSTLIQKVTSKIDAYYQTAQIPAVMQAFVNTTAFADRDLGVDYAPEPGEIVVGAVATGAIASNATFSTGGHATSGEIINGAVMTGANLGRWGMPRWSVFVNGFYIEHSLDALEGELTSAGAHVEYEILTPRGTSGARWLGLFATTGVEYCQWNLFADAPIVTKFTVDGTGTSSINLTLTSTGTLQLIANTVTVPLEITTGVRFLRVLALYAGGGLDLTGGGSTLTAGLKGTMTETSNGTNMGSVMISASGSSSPSAAAVHALGGIQLNVPHFQMYIQSVISPDVTALDVGVRVAF
jgi:hypothetical protein